MRKKASTAERCVRRSSAHIQKGRGGSYVHQIRQSSQPRRVHAKRTCEAYVRKGACAHGACGWSADLSPAACRPS